MSWPGVFMSVFLVASVMTFLIDNVIGMHDEKKDTLMQNTV
jgi:hypothetical protein